MEMVLDGVEEDEADGGGVFWMDIEYGDEAEYCMSLEMMSITMGLWTLEDGEDSMELELEHQEDVGMEMEGIQEASRVQEASRAYMRTSGTGSTTDLKEVGAGSQADLNGVAMDGMDYYVPDGQDNIAQTNENVQFGVAVGLELGVENNILLRGRAEQFVKGKQLRLINKLRCTGMERGQTCLPVLQVRIVGCNGLRIPIE